MTTRIAFQTAIRAAAVEMLLEFKQEYDLTLQIYRARPASILPPTAFVDRMRGTITFDAMREHRPQIDIIFVWGLFDSGDTVDQRDAVMDAWIDFTTDRFHAAGATTGLQPAGYDDDPNFVPDWLPPEKQRTYFATTVTLEGLAGGY